MMQHSALLSAPTPFTLLPKSSPLEARFRNPPSISSNIHQWTKLPLKFSHFHQNTLYPLHSTEIQSVIETMPDESEFIEIGYISNVHGLKGELRVKPSTDFPELRFSKSGRRWLRVRVSGKETIQEIELTGGRGHHGQKNWIVSFGGIDTVDKARQIVGSTLLVREADKPVLEEGEFYTPDLVGMRVILKETGKPVGTVVNVFNSGSSDLLRVMLYTAEERIDGSALSMSKMSPAGPLVWVPFVEAIVPDVDMKGREMKITPPEGLLELNLRSDGRSKKERRQLEWKERVKSKQRLIRAKKKLCEMGQEHLLQGFSFGDKSQRSSLANQIVGISFKLFQQAMQNIDMPSKRSKLSDYISGNSTMLLRNALTIPKDCLLCYGSTKKFDKNHKLQENGLHLMRKGKVAIILVMNDKDNQGKGYKPDFVGSESIENSPNFLHLRTLFLEEKKFAKTEEWQASVPLVVVSPAEQILSLQDFFSNHDYFGFDTKKVWFLEEEKLPVVSSSLTEQSKHNILLKSQWEILQSPMGSGGVFSLLSSDNIMKNLNEMGVDYVQVCSLSQRSAPGHPLPFGFVNSIEADVGIKIFDNMEDDDDFDMIFSMRSLNEVIKQIDKLQLDAILKQNSHVEKVDKEWVAVHSLVPNSYELHCSIYSSLYICSSDKICLMQIVD